MSGMPSGPLPPISTGHGSQSSSSLRLESPRTLTGSSTLSVRRTLDGRRHSLALDLEASCSSPTAGSRKTVDGAHPHAHAEDSNPADQGRASPTSSPSGKSLSGRPGLRFSPKTMGAESGCGSPLGRKSDNGGNPLGGGGGSGRTRSGRVSVPVGQRGSSNNITAMMAAMQNEALARFSESGGALGAMGDGDSNSEKDRDSSGSALRLPDLVAASRRGLPRLRSTKSLKGFMQPQRSESGTLPFSRLSVDGTGGGETSDEGSPRGGGSSFKIGPGGVPSKYDRKQYQPREEDVLNIASNMGMVRKELGGDALKGAASRAKATHVVQAAQVSPLGIQLSVLLRFADSIQSNMSTFEVVSKYVTPQTAQLGCRFIDLVNEKLVDTPAYYVVHCWSMKFMELVDTIRKHFELCKVPESEVVLWIDFYCVNQHRPVGAQELASIADVLKATDKVLFVLDRAGVALSRTWVLWELWLASGLDRIGQIQGVASGQRLLVVPVSWSWEDCYHAFVSMDVLKSSASHEKERALLIADMSRDSSDLRGVVEGVQEVLRLGAKRDMTRATKMANVHHRRYIQAASTYAMLLYLSFRYIEAEDVMRTIKSLMDKMSQKDLVARDEAAYLLHLALIYKEKGLMTEAQRVLNDFDVQFKDLNEEVYLAGEHVLVDMHCALKAYTKAEMLCRKTMELREKLFGRHNHGMVLNMLQMASISVAQHLYDEAEGHTLGAMKLAHQLEGQEGKDAAACYHQLAICYYYTNRKDEVNPLLNRALGIRQRLLGKDHPITLESQSLQAMMLVQARRLAEAENLMNSILRSRMRSYGPEHHDTLETMGNVADLLRSVEKDDEAVSTEKRMLEVARELLKQPRINRFRSLRYIAKYLVTREHLLEKAALFLAKAYIVYKEKLGSEAELTLATKKQLEDIISHTRAAGNQALSNAELWNDPAQFAQAEDMLKQAWSLSRLVQPEDNHTEIAQGLADALFAQDKIQEAKSVMRTAGLVKKGMKQNMPASYLRWLNKRVAKYMDKQGDEMEGFA